MIAVDVARGVGIAGLWRYIAHDGPTSADRQPSTSARVRSITTLWSPTADPALCVRIMQGVRADAPLLKEAAGVGPGGRKLAWPYLHLVFSFEQDELCGPGERLAAVESGLQALGLDERPMIVAEHDDTEYRHFHVIGSVISPKDGRAAPLKNTRLRLQTWAEEYERRHGGVRIATRTKRRKARERLRAMVSTELGDFQPAGKTVRARSAERRAARKAATARARQVIGIEPVTPRPRKKDDRSPAEKALWDELCGSAAYRASSSKEQRAMRAALGAEQKAARLAAAAGVAVPPPPPVAEQTPAPPPPVEEQIELPRPRPEHAAAVGLAAGELGGWIERERAPFGDHVLAAAARDLHRDDDIVDQVAGGALAAVVRNDEARQAREAAEAEARARDRAAWQRRLKDLVAAARRFAGYALQRIKHPPPPGRPDPAAPAVAVERGGGRAH